MRWHLLSEVSVREALHSALALRGDEGLALKDGHTLSVSGQVGLKEGEGVALGGEVDSGLRGTILAGNRDASPNLRVVRNEGGTG